MTTTVTKARPLTSAAQVQTGDPVLVNWSVLKNFRATVHSKKNAKTVVVAFDESHREQLLAFDRLGQISGLSEWDPNALTGTFWCKYMTAYDPT